MKVYDAFLFLNELDLLELRLETLNDRVDIFILAESDYAFSGNKKPRFYDLNKDRFEKWNNKIRYVNIDLSSTFGTPELNPIDNQDTYESAMMPWDRKSYARNILDGYFYDAESDDLIFLSNVDEIWNPEFCTEKLNFDSVTVFLQNKYCYYLNLSVPNYKTQGTKRCYYKNYPGGANLKNSIGTIIESGGWNFSLLGDASDIQYMIDSKSYIENPIPEWRSISAIEKAINEKYIIDDYKTKLEQINIDASFPDILQSQQERWIKNILI